MVESIMEEKGLYIGTYWNIQGHSVNALKIEIQSDNHQQEEVRLNLKK